MGTVSFDFKGEVVVVTGGSRGLGLEIAHTFGQAGAKVVITARREQWLKEAENFLTDQGIIVDAFICNVADAASVEHLVQQTLQKNNRIDVLVNNAGLTWGAPAETMPLERWQQVINANITGTFLMSQAVGRHMLDRKKGAIVNVASIAGLRGGQLSTVGYNSSKAAVINLTRALAVEWGSRNIRINCIAPGMFRTRMTEAIIERGEAIYNTTTPMGRIGQPGEIAPAVLFLASEGASYINVSSGEEKRLKALLVRLRVDRGDSECASCTSNRPKKRGSSYLNCMNPDESRSHKKPYPELTLYYRTGCSD